MKAYGGHSASAVNDYLRSLNLTREDKLIWYDLGLIEQHAGFKASAEHDYEASIADDSRYVPALYNLGTLVSSSDPARERFSVRKSGRHPAQIRGRTSESRFALQAMGQAAQGNGEISEAVRIDPALIVVDTELDDSAGAARPTEDTAVFRVEAAPTFAGNAFATIGATGLDNEGFGTTVEHV